MNRKVCFTFIKRLTLAIVLISLLALLTPGSITMADDEVYFPDPNLREAIRNAIGGGDITQSKLDGLTAFQYGGATIPNITDLTGMEHCTSLTYLYLGSNQIGNISPLASLTSLTTLNLFYNQILSDISPLSSLTSLVNLNLRSNQIGNISALASLTSLVRLHLNNNQISDISPLVANTELSDGDSVSLCTNPLSEDSINIYVPELQDRGVNVECPTGGTTEIPSCFIATAAYGTSTAEEIDVLRAFRDEVLLENSLGYQFVEWYYQTSPPVADLISENSLLKTIVREVVVAPIASLVQFTEAIWGD